MTRQEMVEELKVLFPQVCKILQSSTNWRADEREILARFKMLLRWMNVDNA